MADPLSLLGATIAVVQLAGGCVKLVRSKIGPSKHNTHEIESILTSLDGFGKAIEQFRGHVEARRSIKDHDEEPLDNLDYLIPSLEDCKTALGTIEQFLNKGSVKQIFLGAKFDRKLKGALSSLNDARKLFAEVVGLNSYASSLHIKKLMKNVTQEVQRLHQSSGSDQVFAQELLSHYQDRVKKWLVPHGESDASQYEHFDSLLRARARAPGSCTWLFQYEPFRRWLHDNDAPPLLWVEGQPGLGKSVLCSTAIEHAMNLGRCTIFYYCRFDIQRTVTQAAGCLVEQLFDYLSSKYEDIAHGAMDIAKKISNPTTESLLTMARYLIRELQRIETSESESSPSLLIFLDGLDEESREEEILGPFIFKLLDEFPSVLRVWVSSRPSQRLYNVLQRYPIVHLKEHTGNDVRAYLEAAMYEVDEDSFADGVILQQLLQRCQGNFLFARFLADFIREESFRPNELFRIIQEKLPVDLHRTYQRIIQQYDDRKTASELFSMVVFARRPLRLSELEEAMAIIVPNKVGANLDPRNKPRRIDKMFHPLIEKILNRDEPLNPFVQITHSSVRDFLIKNPRVLCEVGMEENRIGEHHITDACLNYLMQQRYHTPFDSDRLKAIETHHLLTYSAKYWDRHLDAIGSTPERQKKTHVFLRSQNFQTLFQIQSIALEFHFGLFSKKRGDQGRFKKVFPQSLNGMEGKIMMDYYHFVGEWNYFLSCPCRNEDEKCPVYEFRGEITRCLSGLMGRGSFLSNMKERNTSFMLHKGGYDSKAFEPGVCEGVSTNGNKVAIVSAKPTRNSKKLGLTIETWNPRAKTAPLHTETTTLSVIEKTSDLFSYAGKYSNAKKRPNQIDPISFSPNLDMLRIGSQLFQEDEQGKYKEVPGLGDLKIDLTRYFEDFASRDGIIVITRRRNRNEGDIIRPGKTDSHVEFIPNIIHGWRKGDVPKVDAELVKSDDESDDGYSAGTDDEASVYSSCGDISGNDITSSESSEGENSGEESFSEGSASDLEVSDEGDSSDDGNKSLSDNYSDDSKAAIILGHGTVTLDGPKGYVGDSSDEDERMIIDSSDDDIATYRYATSGGRYGRALPTPRRGESGKSKNTMGSIAVIDITGEKPCQIFYRNFELPITLYHSPPVIHPSKPLVVWPLCGGDILFIDHAQRTYFTRRVLTTTRFTRHVCMKVHFSECGTHMHIATIEAQDNRKTHSKSAAGKAPKNLSISVFVTTYRLSEQEDARNILTLVHREKARLGDITNISVSKLPITFTWTRDHVYATQSSYKLTVTRINLFRVKVSSSPAIPRETILLPASAQQREVRYFPPTPADSRGVVLIGSHRSSRYPAVNIRPAHLTHVDVDVRRSPYRFPSPPVGIYVDEEKDLGGWVPAHTGESIRNRYRNGVLIRKIEPFDAEDDCELEDFVSSEDLQ